MKEELISLETAKLAKEKGFNISAKSFYGCDDPCGTTKPNSLITIELKKEGDIETQEGTLIYSAPAQHILQKWLREEHMIKVIVNHAESNGTYGFTIWVWNHDNNIGKWEGHQYLGTYITYEEALEDGLVRALGLPCDAFSRETTKCI